METKKNPKANLETKRGLFVQIGLVFAISISLLAFEWKSYDNSTSDLGSMELSLEDEEIIPVTQREIKPPPPPPPPPEVIQIVEDDVEIEVELEIEETDTDEDEIIEIEEEEEEDEIFNFAVVEDKPIFPGCEDVSKEERYMCFQKGIMNHIRKNFKYPAIPKEMGISEKIFVQFVIDKAGKITKATVVRGEDKHLKGEALRLVNSIPKLQAAKQRGKAVPCSFTVPINFKLQ
ncbi:MAG: energy transducer TonB [Flavobacteriales bacterium]|jgi:protein TonB|nr:energy transducer TonB [bacterium]MDG1396035.1 energy transducer TonB [Flavobacteriales bacterium]|tara:strand:+ start:918 stop:1616 length:699 start_codon:yes stop_codon:yes gene_type:complete